MSKGQKIAFDADRPGMTRIPAKLTGCRCSHVAIHEEHKTVVCQDCKRVYEPFEWLWRIAQRESIWVHRAKELKAKSEKLSQELESLKREERNIRARLVRLRNNEKGES